MARNRRTHLRQKIILLDAEPGEAVVAALEQGVFIAQGGLFQTIDAADGTFQRNRGEVIGPQSAVSRAQGFEVGTQAAA